jgi:hypothetical protein
MCKYQEVHFLFILQIYISFYKEEGHPKKLIFLVYKYYGFTCCSFETSLYQCKHFKV